MVGRNTLIAVVTLLCIPVALQAVGQDESAPEGRRPPLGERLQRFRNELFGEMPRRSMTTPPTGPPRRSVTRSKAIVTGPTEAQPQNQVSQPPTEAAQPPITRNPYVKVPSYLKPQGARPARPGSTRRSATPDEPTPSLRAKLAPADDGVVVDDRSQWDDDHADQTIDNQFSDNEPVGIEPVGIEPENDFHGDLSRDLENDETAPPREPSLAVPDSEQDEALPVDSPDLPPDAGDDSDLRYDGGEESDATTDDGPRLSETGAEPSDYGREAKNDGPQSAGALGQPGSSNVLFTSQSPVLSVAVTGPRTIKLDKEADFVVRVQNQGAAANDVVVTVNIPSYADVAGASPSQGTTHPATAGERHEALAWTIDRVEADSEETLTLTLIPRDSTPLDLSVNWTFTPEASRTKVDVQEPKLAMSLSGPRDVLFGETRVYKLTISNPGNGDTENASVELLPIGRSSESPGSQRLGTLKAGETRTIDIELTARQAGAVTITAQAFADGGLRAEASEQVLVRRASLQVEVEAPRIKYAGTPGSFHVKVANVGNATAENVHVSALLPADAKFMDATSGGKHQQSHVEWTVGPLQPGDQRVLELQCSLSAPGDNRMQFTASADGELSAAATANTRVEAIADLKLEVEDPSGPVAVGAEAVYEVRIHNQGTQAAAGVELVIFFSEGLEAASVDGGPHDIGPGQVVFRPLASLAAGDTAVFHVRARADQSGNHVFRAEMTCASLDVKLATEEATHFYGEPRTAALERTEPNPAAPRERVPTPAADRYADDDPYADPAPQE